MNNEFIKKPWTIEHQRKYKWLYSNLIIEHPEAKEENYIDTHLEYLEDIINNNPKWGIESKKALFFTIGRYLYNKQDSRAEKFNKLGLKLLQQIENTEFNNEFDEKENKNYRDQKFFLDIINETDYKKHQTKEEHLKYLLLCLLVLQPPLRSSFFYSCKLITLKTQNNNVDNFLLVNRGTTEYIINNDKASNYETYKKNKKLNYIQITNNKLKKLIKYSILKYPRLYLLEINNNYISHVSLLGWLRDITKIENINFDIMRSSYINNFYKENETFKQRQELSFKMRHSILTAQKFYIKVSNKNDDDKQDDEKTETEIIEILKIKINELSKKNKELENKLKAYTNINDENINDVKQYNKKRRDVIYNLNVKKRKAKQDTITKYNILYDDETKLYK